MESPESSETVSVQEIADACRDSLPDDDCDEIALQENLDDAFGLASTLLTENGIDDPTEFFIEQGVILEQVWDAEENDWYRQETHRMGKTEQKIWSVLYGLRRKLCLFSGAPKVEGIDESLQEQRIPQLILLKTKRRLADLEITAPPSFGDRKKLALSDKSVYFRNFSLKETPAFHIDEPVRPLVRAINAKPFSYSGECCSGHFNENPEDPKDCMFHDTGYMTFTIDANDSKSAELVDAVRRFCEEETRNDPNCIYSLQEGENGTYYVAWNWSNPTFRKKAEQLKRREIKNTPEEQKIFRKMWAMSPLARKKEIPKKHGAFIAKLTKLIENFKT